MGVLIEESDKIKNLRSKSIHQKGGKQDSPEFKLYTKGIGNNSLEDNQPLGDIKSPGFSQLQYI